MLLILLAARTTTAYAQRCFLCIRSSGALAAQRRCHLRVLVYIYTISIHGARRENAIISPKVGQVDICIVRFSRSAVRPRWQSRQRTFSIREKEKSHATRPCGATKVGTSVRRKAMKKKTLKEKKT